MDRCSLICIVGVLLLLIFSYQHLIVTSHTAEIVEGFETDSFMLKLTRLQNMYRDGNLTPRAYTEAVNNLESGDSQESTKTSKPSKPNPHVAHVTFQTDGYWKIYHNDTYVSGGNPTGGGTATAKIEGVRDYHKLKFQIGGGGLGGLVAQIKIGDRVVVTNSTDFKITGQQITVNPGERSNSVGFPARDYLPEFSGGKYQGCFQDGDPRALPHYQGENFSLQKCHQAAVDNDYPYYGIQYGGECWLGKQRSKYNELSPTRCGMRCSQNSNEYCGASMTNQVYSILDPPEIIEVGPNVQLSQCQDCITNPENYWCGKNSTCTRHGDSSSPCYSGRDQCVGSGCDASNCQQLYPGLPNKSGDIDGAARWIIPKQHGLTGNFPGGTWEFVWTNTPSPKISFCNYRRYNKFQPSGCDDPTDSTRCWETSKPNYQADPDTCGKVFKFSGDYDGPTFFSIINRAYRNRDQPGVNQDRAKQFTKSMETAHRAACQVILEAKHRSKYEALCHGITQHPSQHQCDIPTDQRQAVTSLASTLQDSLPGSPDWEQAKTECRANRGCFESEPQTKPRCYQPDLSRPRNSTSSSDGNDLHDLDGLLKKIRKQYVDGNISTDQFTDRIFELGLKVEREPTNLPDGSPSARFFSAVTEASRLMSSKDLEYSNAVGRYKYAMETLLDHARMVEWDPGNQKGCQCQDNYPNPDGLKCFPC